VALVGTGFAYAALSPEPHTAHATADSALVARGQQIYNRTCLTCHGPELTGVPGRGVSLVGVGEAAVYFQTASGRMPLAAQGPQALRKPAVLTPDEIDAVAAFVDANGGGGPERPAQTGEALRGTNPAAGGELYRLNCASCHNFTGRGGALSSGKHAPVLDHATEDEIYTAMLTGPENMPKFGDRQLTPQEKKDIIAYVKSVTSGRTNFGGNPLGGFGPVPEGLIAFVVGMAALVGVTLWIGAKN
jgi:ubiquinol-cytochrome c reductase cytochrome c subunit